MIRLKIDDEIEMHLLRTLVQQFDEFDELLKIFDKIKK